jgi:hypothetical protein
MGDASLDPRCAAGNYDYGIWWAKTAQEDQHDCRRSGCGHSETRPHKPWTD